LSANMCIMNIFCSISQVTSFILEDTVMYEKYSEGKSLNFGSSQVKNECCENN
jgi:hypothetical protein